MQRLRVLVLLHDYQIPPPNVTAADLKGNATWRTEYDVLKALRNRPLRHHVEVVGVDDDLSVVQQANEVFKPHIAFNLLEAFHEVGSYDQNMVSYLELLRLPYAGCNPRGMILARDKALSKQLLHSHGVAVPAFTVVGRGRKARLPKHMGFPVIVKSKTQEASLGISQASVVTSEARMAERVQFVHDSIGTEAIVEEFIEGRELYCGVLGNDRLEVLPPFEMFFENMPQGQHRIATERVKWSLAYQKKMKIMNGLADPMPEATENRIRRISGRVFKILQINGFARVDLRLTPDGRIYVLEANPNPQIARQEDFARSAECVGYSYPRLLQRILNLGLRWRPDHAG